MEPYTIITTVQPVIVAWISAITFFVSLSIVAILSRGRKWYELVCLFFVVFVALAAAGLFSVQAVFDIHLLEVELIRHSST